MKKRSLLLGTAVAAVLAATPGVLRTDHAGPGFMSTAQAQRSSNLDISIFFDELAPHGRWLSTRRHSYVWVPDSVAQIGGPIGWSVGVHSANGWLWVSDEPYGWAVYHYGRWGYDEEYGWFWVPGSEWAPAWVSWQYSDEYVGWAALPPSGSGYAFSISTGPTLIGIGAWRLCQHATSWTATFTRTFCLVTAIPSCCEQRGRPGLYGSSTTLSSTT